MNLANRHSMQREVLELLFNDPNLPKTHRRLQHFTSGMYPVNVQMMLETTSDAAVMMLPSEYVQEKLRTMSAENECILTIYTLHAEGFYVVPPKSNKPRTFYRHTLVVRMHNPGYKNRYRKNEHENFTPPRRNTKARRTQATESGGSPTGNLPSADALQ